MKEQVFLGTLLVIKAKKVKIVKKKVEGAIAHDILALAMLWCDSCEWSFPVQVKE